MFQDRRRGSDPAQIFVRDRSPADISDGYDGRDAGKNLRNGEQADFFCRIVEQRRMLASVHLCMHGSRM